MVQAGESEMETTITGFLSDAHADDVMQACFTKAASLSIKDQF
jgi:hypothetical protein